MRTAKSEFPEVYVPPTLARLVENGLLEDTSWHNDAAASFEVRRGKEGYRLWLYSLDPARRELPGPRCRVERLAAEEGEPGPLVLETESVTHAVDAMLRFAVGVAVGDRVRFRQDHDLYPHALVPEGAEGVVVGIDVTARERCVRIKLTKYMAGLDEWDNEAHLTDDGDGDEGMAQHVLAMVQVVDRP